MLRVSSADRKVLLVRHSRIPLSFAPLLLLFVRSPAKKASYGDSKDKNDECNADADSFSH